MVDATYHRRWRAANRESVEASQRRYKEKTGADVIALASNHNLSMVDARAALDARPDCCDICGRHRKLYYDHDHATSAHRGWLCNRCNVALAFVEDPALLATALQYLGE